MKTVILIVLALILVLFLLYALLLRGRNGHKGMERLQGWAYAHRGLHDKPFIPENSLTAFRLAAEKGYGAELDVHLLKDGTLAVFHDSALKRCTGADGILEDLTADDLQNYFLEGTRETIPTLRQVLDIFEDKAPLIIELKAYKNNCAQLTEAVCKELESYKGAYCLESFDPRCLIWLKKNRPDLIRGQLSKNYFGDTNGLKPSTCFMLTHSLSHFITMPDFTAYKFADRKNLSTWICRRLYGVQGVSWTLQTKEEYDTAVAEGWIPIFEGFEP